MGKTVTIVFDENSYLWCENDTLNDMHIKYVREHIMDTYNIVGYVYLNKIYSDFGIVWDPYDENLVWIKERGDELSISWAHEIGDSKWYVHVEHK